MAKQDTNRYGRSIYCLNKGDDMWQFLVNGEYFIVMKHHNYWSVSRDGFDKGFDGVFEALEYGLNGDSWWREIKEC